MRKLLILSILFSFILASCHRKIEKVVETYSNGNPKLVFVYDKDSVKIGEIGYSPDKKVRLEGICEGDKYVGIWKYYHDNGKLFAQGDFKTHTTGDNWIFNDTAGNSLIEKGYKVRVISFNKNEFSPSEIQLFQDSTSNVIDIKFFTNYKPYIIERQVDGVRNGLSTSWFSTGIKNSECYYKDGMKNGINKVWHENGNLFYEGEYAMDKKSGAWKAFDKNGKLIVESNYADDMREGKFTEWYRNGKQRTQGQYSKNKEVGTWLYYDENGTLTSQKTMK